MIKKHLIYITLLSGLFFFTTINTGQGPSLADELQRLALKQGLVLTGNQLNDLINLLKEKYGIVSPYHKTQQEHLNVQLQTAIEELNFKKKQGNIQDKQDRLIDEQIKGHEYDNLLKLRAVLNTLDHNDPEHAVLSEQIKAIVQKITGSTNKEEIKKNPQQPEKRDENKPKEDGFWKTLAMHFMFAAATAGTIADSIADYSVEYITGDDLFKDTFVNKYKKVINRTVVAVTLYAILHKSYSLYKKYQAERNATEDDIFADDED